MTGAADRPDDGIIIRLSGVGKRFGPVVAVDDVSLDLRVGEFFCLLGPSGCGKSTLLRLIAGFESVDAGAIFLGGRDLAPVPPHRRPVNMMFQSYALFPHLGVAGNVGYGLRMAGLPRREIAERVGEMLRLVGLEGLGERSPAQLSGGQRQRVALARALARRPRVLLLDEPLGALDRALRERTQEELKRIQSRLGTTFVVVTHDASEAMALSDRIGLMDRGRLVQVGPPREIYERPASRFAATFLGDANLLEGEIAGDGPGDTLRVRLGSGREVEARPPEGPSPRPGQRVAVAVRPGSVVLAQAGGGSSPNAVAGRVVETTFLGETVATRISIEAGDEIRATAPARSLGGREPRPGEVVMVGFAPADAMIVTS